MTDDTWGYTSIDRTSELGRAIVARDSAGALHGQALEERDRCQRKLQDLERSLRRPMHPDDRVEVIAHVERMRAVYAAELARQAPEIARLAAAAQHAAEQAGQLFDQKRQLDT